jgi:hypothetical protein
MATPTYADVLQSKHLTLTELKDDFKKLKSYKPNNMKRCFAGNPILYHFQLNNLCQVKTKAGSFYELMCDETKKEDMWQKANKYANGSRPDAPALRLFEMYRRLTGAVVFFKPTIAINFYDYCKATSVLDPCAGWGGRLLGAMARDIDYTGIDTNTNLRDAYTGLMETFETKSKTAMIWDDAMNVDFSVIDYDCVLTSPPYYNVEIYECMTAWKDEPTFYKTFLIPLIDKCRKHIRRNGKVCFNISPPMYKKLLTFGYEKCKEELPMLQQKVQGKDKADKLYIW